MSGNALGLIETRGLIGAIEACDAAAKAAQVVVTSAEVTDGGLVTLKIEGDLGAVKAAVAAGSKAAQKVGGLICAHVIPRPDDGLSFIHPPTRYANKYHPDYDRPASSSSGPSAPTAPTRSAAAAKPPTPPKTPPAAPTARLVPRPAPPVEPASAKATLKELEAMPVVKLRQFARAVKNLPILGRQISMANKTELIAALKSVMDLE